MADELDPGTLRDFVEEAREHVVTLNRDFLELEDKGAAAPAELVNEAFRAIHTVKGLSGMLGLKAVNVLAHGMEDALSEVRQGRATVTGLLAQSLFEALDRLSAMVDTAAGGAMPQDDVTPLVSKIAVSLKARADLTPAPPLPEARPAAATGWQRYTSLGLSIVRVTLAPDVDTPAHRRRVLDTLEALESLGERLALEPEDVEKRLAAKKKLRKLEVVATLATRLSVDELKLELGPSAAAIDVIASPPASGRADAEATAAPPRLSGSAAPTSRADDQASQSIRVDAAKLDRVLALVGELVILRSRYNHVATRALADLDAARGTARGATALRGELNEVESTMSRTLGELQDAVMNARLVPLGSVFGKLERIARDAAAGAGKKVKVVSTGGETELDKKVIDQIAAPLTHLVRNAVDHGIEPIDRRTSAGKPVEGVVSVDVRQEGDRVVIEVSDDGRGLDREKILATAVSRGLVAKDAGRLSDAEVMTLICKPGFSTADTVTDVSGRGVGMDVVNEAVSRLKGVLQMESLPGTGSTFRIRLPLTMAIVDALLVTIGSETYAIPVGSVREIVELDPRAVHVAAGREFFQSLGGPVPIVRLAEALCLPGPETLPERPPTVIVESGDGEVGLVVDEVVGQREIVVKSLSKRFEAVAEISGGSVLGDGSVCLILDVPSLVARFGRRDGPAIGATS
jgi:two-component system chemotaxis sensor kinase CheA